MSKALGLISLGMLLLALLYAAANQERDFVLRTHDGLELALSPEGTVVGLSVDGFELVRREAPALLLRDLTGANETERPNLVGNPSFEEGLSGWSRLVNNRLSVQITQAQAHSGGQALQFASLSDTAGFAAYASEPLPVEPGTWYRVGAWWKSKEGYLSTLHGTPPLLQRDLYRETQRLSGLYVQWLDGSGQIIGDPEMAVALHMNAESWRFIQREVIAPEGAGSVRVVVAAKLQNETLWVDDVRLIESSEPRVPLTGTVRQEDDRLIQTAQAEDLEVEMIYEARESFIAVHGEVRNLTAEDRAFELAFMLPVAASGWLWWDDAHRSRPISQGLYANVISAVFDGFLPISLYPYAGIENGTVGLALALPPDRPQLALLFYDADMERLAVLFHLGISPRAAKLDNRAAFELLIYRFDPRWGFRSVIARHGQFFPEIYNTDLAIYDYSGAEQGHFLTPSAAEIVREHDEQGIYSAQYTVGELPIKVKASGGPRPTLEEILQAVEELGRSGKPGAAEFVRAIGSSAAVDTNGDWILKHVGVFSWDPENWEASWAANLDPDLEGGLARWLIDWRIDPAFEATQAIGAQLDGVQIDNFMSTPAIDFRPEALQNADHTLTYSPHTYEPGVHNGFAMFEYLRFLRGHLDEHWGENRGISVNFWGLGHPNYLAGFIDAFGGEGKTTEGRGINWDPEILDYRRAVAYHKPLLFANQTPQLTEEAARRFRALALLYGVWVRQGPHGTGWSPAVNEIMEETAALVERYWWAGWEPIPHAWADNPAIWVERFGDDLAEGIFFSAYNSSDTAAAFTLKIDAALGIEPASPLTIIELVSGEAMPFTFSEDGISLPALLEGQSAAVFMVQRGE